MVSRLMKVLLHITHRKRSRRRCSAAHSFGLEYDPLGSITRPRAASRSTGYEMLKGLQGVRTHEHAEFLPIIENSQDMPALAELVGSNTERAQSRARFSAATSRALLLGTDACTKRSGISRFSSFCSKQWDGHSISRVRRSN